MKHKKVLLVILDGWGQGDGGPADIISQANVPFTRNLYNTAAHNLLRTSGEDVGLPEGQMGNSEVGHLNIGAGRVVYQDLVKISQAITDRSFHQNDVLVDAFNYAKEKDRKSHV